MKIVVFGATGGTGKNVVERALAAGHEVVAAVRRPEAVVARERLRVCKADVLEADSVASAIQGTDAVICCVGPASNAKPGTLISVAAKNIVDGCAKVGVRRVVLESGMITSDGTELTFLGRTAVGVFAMIFPKLKADKLIAEATVTGSSLDWVIVRPPALGHSPPSGKYLAAPGAQVMPAKTLSHADCAEALLKAATDTTWVRQIVNVGHG